MNTIQLIKNEIKASLILSRQYRLAGDRESAFQFLNDANQARAELNQRMGWA
ncbi:MULTISPECIES: hypothetical protein [Photobacterium]|uniref:hypothetical protein n=1 Tax=Photobacterium TaxID=657 RepID=UPI0013C51608|nr:MULTISPECIES: hypothetical protein [Photobacterium]